MTDGLRRQLALSYSGAADDRPPAANPDEQRAFHICKPQPPIAAQAECRPSLHQKSPLHIRHGAFMALRTGEAVRRDSPTPRPVTAQRIERVLDRVAEIIVARGDHGEAWLPLYDHLERALQDHWAKEERLAAVRQRVIRSQDRAATRSS